VKVTNKFVPSLPFSLFKYKDGKGFTIYMKGATWSGASFTPVSFSSLYYNNAFQKCPGLIHRVSDFLLITRRPAILWTKPACSCKHCLIAEIRSLLDKNTPTPPTQEDIFL